MARAQKIGRPGIPADRLRSLWALVQANPQEVAARFGASPAALMGELEGEMRKLETSEAAAARAARLKGMTAEEKVGERLCESVLDSDERSCGCCWRCLCKAVGLARRHMRCC
jgi:hypothetical protein